MKEVVFTSRNSKRWQALEELLKDNNSIDPELLSRMYIRLSDDLSYARTYYPTSNIALYLNNLVVKIHHQIYKNKKADKKQFFHFWKITVPLVTRKCHRYLFFSVLIFLISAWIGWISTGDDNSFTRLILGDQYVNKTLENIQNNDPMAVYKQMNNVQMFLGITVNNIQVAFLAYVCGLIFAVGTGYILFQNGIMMGTFIHLFYSKGLLVNCLLTIFLHGTFEIFAILLAGGAGLMMGSSWLFPGTWSRLNSFRMGVKNSIQVLAGVVPVFIVAGFIEGFLTRHTELSPFLKLSVILISLAIILTYYILIPIKIFKSQQHGANDRP